MSIGVAIAGFAFLVVIHELGHLLAAKAVGMRATRFFLFFPPKLASVTWRGTEYGIGMIPLGGFVKIVGMTRPRGGDLVVCRETVERATAERDPAAVDALTPALARAERALDANADAATSLDALQRLRDALAADSYLVDPERLGWCAKELDRLVLDCDPNAYWRKETWRRLVAIFAGPAMNFLAAVVILFAWWVTGAQVPDKLTSSVDVVLPGSVAATMGLRADDVILAVNGAPARNDEAVRAAIQRPGTVTLTVRRGTSKVSLGPVTPEKGSDGRRVLGFGFGYTTKTVRLGPVTAAKTTGRQLWYITTNTYSALAHIFEKDTRRGMGSAVGAVQQSSRSVDRGEFPFYLALLSWGLALVNLLPFLPLDGGHILFAVLERIRRRPIAREVYERVSVIGLAAVLGLFAIGLLNDLGGLLHNPSIVSP